MITRNYLRLDTAIRYSWKNIIYSVLCAAAAWYIHVPLGMTKIAVPISVVAILGTALAIILGFRNSSAYDRWWEARKIWGGVVNESRTFTRQAMTIVDPKHYPEALREVSTRAVRQQIAWVNALRLQLRNIKDQGLWDQEIGAYLRPGDYNFVMSKSNKVTQLGMLNGATIKELQAHEEMDIFSYIQMDDTITRLTDLQGRAERIKSTPLPRPYDYYTMAFLSLFIFFFPFAFIETFMELSASVLVIPVTAIVGWIFYQIYVFGKVLSNPFENWKTDVALHAISRVIEIDLKEIIEEETIPAPLTPEKGSLM